MQEVDARGLLCPLPLLAAKKALKALAAGECVRIIASDPSTQQDFIDFCSQTGDKLVTNTLKDGNYHFIIQKAHPHD